MKAKTNKIVEDLDNDDVAVVDTEDTTESEAIVTQDDTAGEQAADTAVPTGDVEPVAESAAEPKTPSKMDLAKEIYNRMSAEGKARKDIIKAFVDEAKLTQAGAATYYQKLAPKKS